MSIGATIRRNQRPFVYAAVALATSVASIPLLAELFLHDDDQLEPQGAALNWDIPLLGLHLITDVLIGAAYVAISISIIHLARKSGHRMPFAWTFVAFGIFIIACGLTHFMAAITVWEPVYWIAGGVKYVTAVASVGTAVLVPPLVPKVLRLVEAAQASSERKQQLEATNTELVAMSQRLQDDIAERARIEEALRESEERFRKAFSSVATGMAIATPDGRWTQVNESFCDMLGYAEDELLNLPYQAVTHPDDVDISVEHVRRLRSGEISSFQLEKRYLHRDGHVVWGLLSTSMVRDRAGDPLYFVSQIQDITDRKTLEDELRTQAFHDALTGLPNRACFVDRLDRALAPRHAGNTLAVLFLDLDNFKVVNDSVGHTAGDQLLKSVGERLRACLRPGDVVARLGGDEFTVLLEELGDEREAALVAERIAEHLRLPLMLDSHEFVMTTSVGIVIGAPGQDNADEMLRNADIAMYAAKRQKARYMIYDASMNERLQQRLQLETELRRGLAAGELRLHYQPLVDLDSGRISEVEALVRWQHPTRGLLSPAEFIPIAEESGLILPLGAWVLEEACRQAVEWQTKLNGAEDLLIGVNLSGSQFLQPTLAHDIIAVLRSTGLAPRSLKLEISELVAMDDAETTIATLQALRDIGARLAIDDFGTGYSGMSALKRYPVDTLKIDRSFINGLGNDADDTAIVRATIALAREMRLSVTAEGVETLDQIAELRALDCDRGQGYYFARPLPPESIAAILAGTPHWLTDERIRPPWGASTAPDGKNAETPRMTLLPSIRRVGP